MPKIQELSLWKYLAKLHSKHEKPSGANYGINLETKRLFDSIKHNIIEPKKIITQALQSATEMSMMILRIDEVISAARGGSGPRMPQSPQDDLDD